MNKKAKIQVFNIEYTCSADPIDSISFCCLINQCGFNSTDLNEFLFHIDYHPQKWCGWCYSCEEQIHDYQQNLVIELQHMTEAHYSKKELAGHKPSYTEDITPPPCSKFETYFRGIPNETLSTTNDSIEDLKLSTIEYNDPQEATLTLWGNRTGKSQQHYEKMLLDTSLYALYKCMGENCSYTTANAENMVTHLGNHEMSYASHDDLLNNWLECAYCDEPFIKTLLLVKHVQNEHKSSIFQCPYCFYRSCAEYNVIVHLNQFHQSEKERVLVCNGNTKSYATEKALIEKCRSKNVRPLRCNERKCQ